MTDLDDDTYGDEPAPVGHNQPPTFEEEVRAEHQDVFLRLEALKLARGRLPAKIETDVQNAEVGRWAVEARAVIAAADKAHKAACEPYKVKAAAIDKLFLTRGVKGEIEALRKVVQALADDYAARKERERREELARQAEQRRLQEEAAAYEAEALREAGSHSAAEVVESQSEHASKAADRLENKAQGKAADVLRTQHEGVTASGRTRWIGEVVDLDKIDLNALRDAGAFYASEIEQVLQRFVDGGGRECAGARIYEKVIATFR